MILALLSWVWWCARAALYCWVIGALHQAFQPIYATADADRRKQMFEVPQRLVNLLHAALVSAAGFGYVLGVVPVEFLLEARVLSTSFLLHDAARAWQCDQLCGTTTTLGQRPPASSANDPTMVAFHHAVTLLFMYGWSFGDPSGGPQISGLLAFYLSEFPVVTLQIMWLCMYFGQRDTALNEVCLSVSVLTYFALRVVGYPLFFCFLMVPNMRWWNPLTYLMVLLLAAVYALNVLWFYKLSSRYDAASSMLPEMVRVVLSAVVDSQPRGASEV